MTTPGPISIIQAPQVPLETKVERGQIEIINGSHPHFAGSTSAAASTLGSGGGASRARRGRLWTRGERRGDGRVEPDPKLSHGQPSHPSVWLAQPHILPVFTPFPPHCPSPPSSSPSSHSSNSAALAYPTKATPSLLTCARYSTRHLDNTVRSLRDSDAQPNKCMNPICILGVKHPGYEALPRTASRGCSCRRARGGTGWVAWWGGGAPSASTRTGAAAGVGAPPAYPPTPTAARQGYASAFGHPVYRQRHGLWPQDSKCSYSKETNNGMGWFKHARKIWSRTMGSSMAEAS